MTENVSTFNFFFFLMNELKVVKARKDKKKEE